MSLPFNCTLRDELSTIRLHLVNRPISVFSILKFILHFCVLRRFSSMMFDKYVGSVPVTKNLPSSARDREKW